MISWDVVWCVFGISAGGGVGGGHGVGVGGWVGQVDWVGGRICGGWVRWVGRTGLEMGGSGDGGTVRDGDAAGLKIPG